MKHPERTVAYRNGEFSRRVGKGRDANPYRLNQRVEHYLWLAGWHDKDMELLKSSNDIMQRNER